MITKEEFIGYITYYQEFMTAIERLEKAICGRKYTLCLNETDWYSSVDKMFDLFIISNFTSNGSDLIYWWLFEDVNKIIYHKDISPSLFDREEIKYDVNDIEDLWKYMISHEGYFKE